MSLQETNEELFVEGEMGGSESRIWSNLIKEMKENPAKSPSSEQCKKERIREGKDLLIPSKEMKLSDRPLNEQWHANKEANLKKCIPEGFGRKNNISAEDPAVKKLAYSQYR